MRPKLWTLAVAGAVVATSLLAGGAKQAQAQLVVATPGVSVGVGVPPVAAYPTYGVGVLPAPVYGYGYGYAVPAVPAYPVARPYPYVYRPGYFVGPRPPMRNYWYGGGYRRW